ncbi:MAG: hypothetical protein R3A44_41185 [Caldilineaceae bacterium]
MPDATSVLSYNRFMYTRGNPLNRTDPTGHNDAIFDQYGGGGGKEALLIKAAIDLVAITIATQRATYGPPPLVAPRVPSWDEFWPQQQEEQPSVTGFPTITAEDDGLLSTPSGPAPGVNVLTEPLDQAEVGSNVVAAKVINSNMGHAAEQAVARAGFLTEQAARQALQTFGRNIERNGLPADAITDTAHDDRIIVPGFGEGGAVVYQLTEAGKLRLKTVLIWREPTENE